MRLARFSALYRRFARDHRRERMLLASASFFLTFALARLLVHGMRSLDRPIAVWVGGIHLHHFVFGIGLLLAVGYLWLIQVGTAVNQRLGRVTALAYGAGAALTLDEFALWLHLDDVYWQPAGGVSVDAAVTFGSLVSVGVWGGPFWRAALRQLGRPGRRFARRFRAEAAANAGATAQGIEEILSAAEAPVEAVVSVATDRDRPR